MKPTRKSASTLSPRSIALRTDSIAYQPLAIATKEAADARHNTIPLLEKDLLPWIQGGRMSSKTAGVVSLIVRSRLLKYAHDSERPIPDEDMMMDFTLKALESLKNNLKPTGSPDFDHKNLVVTSVYYSWLSYFKPQVNTTQLNEEIESIASTSDEAYGEEYEDNLFGMQLDLFSKLLSEVSLGCDEVAYRDYLVKCVAGDRLSVNKAMCTYVKTRFKVAAGRLNEDLVSIAEVIAKMKSMRGDE